MSTIFSDRFPLVKDKTKPLDYFSTLLYEYKIKPMVSWESLALNQKTLFVHFTKVISLSHDPTFLKQVQCLIVLNFFRIHVLKTLVYPLGHKSSIPSPRHPVSSQIMAKTHFHWNSFRIWVNYSLTICSCR